MFLSLLADEDSPQDPGWFALNWKITRRTSSTLSPFQHQRAPCLAPAGAPAVWCDGVKPCLGAVALTEFV